MNITERQLREAIVDHGRQLFDRRFTHGSTGNLSVRTDEGVLITPTGTSLGRLDPDRIAKVSFSGEHLSGEQPSKEAFLHLSMYRVRPKETAIVHLHSTWSVAVSCLKGIDVDNVLPPITAYQQMRVGRCPLVPYYPPGDVSLAAAVEHAAAQAKAMLLANHGPVVAAKSLAGAVAAAEELEETAKLFLLLRGEAVRWLTEPECQEIRERFPD